MSDQVEVIITEEPVVNINTVIDEVIVIEVAAQTGLTGPPGPPGSGGGGSGNVFIQDEADPLPTPGIPFLLLQYNIGGDPDAFTMSFDDGE